MDIHRNAIHLAQVEKVGGKFILDACWTAFPEAQKTLSSDGENSDDHADPHQAIESMIRQAQAARGLFSQAPTAFTVGDGNIDYRELDVAVDDTCGFEEAVQNELQKESNYDLDSPLLKAWELPSYQKANSRKQSAAVVSADYGFTIWLGERVTHAGYTPEVLDAIPCALGRSAEMFLAGSDQSCLMVHLGDACTTLTQVQLGQPLVTRVLNQHGFENVLLPLGLEFGIGPTEAYFLLLKASKAAKEQDHPYSLELMEILTDYQTRFVHALAAEIYRTLEYIRAEQFGSDPTGILLCGNGSIMPDACLQLEQLLELPSEAWTIPLCKGLCPAVPTSLYAVSAGLSAIAWERS